MLGRRDVLGVEIDDAAHGSAGRKKWVTMAEALGWGLSERPATSVMSRDDAQTVEPGEQPAPTFTVKSGGQWQWIHDRPATTVACDPRVFRPGSHWANGGRAPVPGRSEGAVRIEPRDALLLQSFPADYPVQGSRSKQFEQIGNAVPPLLAKATLEPLLLAG